MGFLRRCLRFHIAKGQPVKGPCIARVKQSPVLNVLSQITSACVWEQPKCRDPHTLLPIPYRYKLAFGRKTTHMTSCLNEGHLKFGLPLGIDPGRHQRTSFTGRGGGLEKFGAALYLCWPGDILNDMMVLLPWWAYKVFSPGDLTFLSCWRIIFSSRK